MGGRRATCVCEEREREREREEDDDMQCDDGMGIEAMTA
jgi:hypothetical protein